MRRLFSTLLATALFALPLLASAQIGPLVPCDGPECQVCHAVTLGQRIINFLVTIASSLAVIMFAYAGFQILTARGNSSKITEAWGIFTNVMIGLVIVLAGWLIVDTVMKAAFEGSELDNKAKEDWKFGPWNEIQCVLLPTNIGPGPEVPRVGGSGVVTTQPGGGRGTGAQCNPGNTACSPAAIEAVGYTQAQANVMSCIAMTESSGNPNGRNNRSGACGTFQILQSNWSNPRLHQANCSNAVCNDAACNLQTAYLLSRNRMIQGQSPYEDWTSVYPNGPQQGQPFNPRARTCVEMYDAANKRW
jgi:hypothetical protein